MYIEIHVYQFSSLIMQKETETLLDKRKNIWMIPIANKRNLVPFSKKSKGWLSVVLTTFSQPSYNRTRKYIQNYCFIFILYSFPIAFLFSLILT